jgi:hypothetical protein
MQSKHYTILDSADLAVVRAWVSDPDNHCYLITQGLQGSEIHNLCVHQHPGMSGVFELTESALAGLIVETAWPE